MVTVPCVGSASLVAMGFDSINEKLSLIKATKPISIRRFRAVPIALGFSCSRISRRVEEKEIQRPHAQAQHQSSGKKNWKTVWSWYFFFSLKNRKVL